MNAKTTIHHLFPVLLTNNYRRGKVSLYYKYPVYPVLLSKFIDA